MAGANAAKAHATMAGYPQAALFDLDGTLVNSVPDITVSVAELLATEGLEPLDEAVVQTLVGHGLGPLVTRAFLARGISLDAQGQAAMLERMWGIYPTHLTERTTLAPGTMECLDELTAAGCAVALVTNKRQTAAAEIIAHFSLAGHFTLIVGESDHPNGLQLKPSADMLKFALKRLGVEPAHAVMVGDSSADIRAAAAAKVFSIGLRNGYSTEPIEHYAPDVAIDSLLDFPLALEAWRHRDRPSAARPLATHRPDRPSAARRDGK